MVTICGKCQSLYNKDEETITTDALCLMPDKITSIETRIMEMMGDISYIKREVLLSRLMLAIFFLITLAVLLFLE